MTRDEIVDDDAVRDAVVFRASHGLCSHPSCTSARPVRLGAVVHIEGHPALVAGPAEIPGGVFRYPCCGLLPCEAWLVAQELLGRLPHQSTAIPRARWQRFSREWALVSEGATLAVVSRHGVGWAATNGDGPSYTWHATLAAAQQIAEYTVAEVLLGRRRLEQLRATARWLEVGRPGHPHGWRLETPTEYLAFVELESVAETVDGLEERWRSLVWLRDGARYARLLFASRHEAQLWAEREATRDREPRGDRVQP